MNPANALSPKAVRCALVSQAAFDVCGLLWWLRWLLPSLAPKQGDGMTFRTNHDASSFSSDALSPPRLRASERL